MSLQNHDCLFTSTETHHDQLVDNNAPRLRYTAITLCHAGMIVNGEIMPKSGVAWAASELVVAIIALSLQTCDLARLNGQRVFEEVA